jgi:serine/threonine protein kinase
VARFRPLGRRRPTGGARNVPVEPADEVVARRIGQKVGDRWTLERLLGIGGMAAVYAAHDDAGASAAIKILHPEMSLRRDVRERFLREAYVANKVGHGGAVGVVEHFDGGEDQAYLVMELLDGEPLSERVRRHGTLPVAELLDYLDQILDVIAAAHDQGIVHRDLKPDNLFVTNDGRVKILDFGVARLLHDAPGDYKTRTGMALGTLPYMAPEQALGRRAEIDGRADVFALGATAFRILAGRKVHEEPSDAELLMAMASKPAPALASVAPSVPPEVCAVVDLALAFSKEARYPDARAMQGDVRALRRGEPPPFATSRLTAREQSTRLDMPAVVPVAAAQPARTPTVVAPAAPASHPATVVQAPPSAAGAQSGRTPTAVAPASPVPHPPTVVAAARVQAAASLTPVATVVMPARASEPSEPVPNAPGTPAPHVTAPAQSEQRPAPRRSPLVIALGLLAVAAILGAVVFAFTDSDTPSAAEPTAPDESESTQTSGQSAAKTPAALTPGTAATPAPPPPAVEKRGKGRGKGKHQR